jgi:hypothetical protein
MLLTSSSCRLRSLSHNHQPFHSPVVAAAAADKMTGEGVQIPNVRRAGDWWMRSEMTTIIGFSDDQQIRFALQNERHSSQRRRGVALGKIKQRGELLSVHERSEHKLSARL